jgi:hypothetical protein
VRKAVFLRSGFSEIEQTAEGGLLIATPEMVKLAAPSGTRTLAVAVARESLPLLLHRRLRLRSTRPASLQVTLRRGRTPVVSLTVPGSRGLTTIRLPRKLAPGPYFVRVRASTYEGALAVDRLAVLIGSRLPTPIGRAAHKGAYYDRFDATFSRAALRSSRSAGEPEDIPLVKRCHRFHPRRVDCVVGDVLVYEDRIRRCLWVGAATLSRSGYIYTRPYRCPRRKSRMPFKRKPRWSAPARESAPLSALLDY